MYRTRVGYTGGRKQSPTYHSLGDHTEALQIDFDPVQISFADIVDLFWKCHDPCSGPRSPQYRSVIWFHDDAQRDTITAAKAAIEARLSEKVRTPVTRLNVFYPAEDYHQKFRLQNSPLRSRFTAMYPNFEDFNRSTAAARLNGFLAGHGSRQLFEAESSDYGIPADDLVQAVRFTESSGGSSTPTFGGCSRGV